MADGVGAGGHVAAIEPSETLAPLINWTLSLNGLSGTASGNQWRVTGQSR